MLVSSQTAVKGGQGFDIAVGIENLRGGDWDETQNGVHRVRLPFEACTRDQARFR